MLPGFLLHPTQWQSSGKLPEKPQTRITRNNNQAANQRLIRLLHRLLRRLLRRLFLRLLRRPLCISNRVKMSSGSLWCEQSNLSLKSTKKVTATSVPKVNHVRTLTPLQLHISSNPSAEAAVTSGSCSVRFAPKYDQLESIWNRATPESYWNAENPFEILKNPEKSFWNTKKKKPLISWKIL